MRRRGDRAFGVRHHSQHPAILADHAGDIARRSIDRLVVTEGHQPFAFEHVERFAVGKIVAVVMRDRNADRLARIIALREDRGGVLDGQRRSAADEPLAGIAQQRTGQQPRFGQHLKAVAHAQHGHAACGGIDDRAHDRAGRRHRARAQIVAIGKPARQRDQVEPFGQVGIAVPHPDRRGARHRFQRGCHVPVAVRTREGDHRCPERHHAAPSIVKLSTTVLASRRSHIALIVS